MNIRDSLFDTHNSHSLFAIQYSQLFTQLEIEVRAQNNWTLQRYKTLCSNQESKLYELREKTESKMCRPQPIDG